MIQHITLQTRRVTLLTLAAALGLLTVLPAILPAYVSAAPAITERELVSTTAQPGVANDLTWRFDTPATAGTIEYIEVEFCDSPLSACTVPNGANNAAADNIPILPASPTAVIGGPGGWAAPANSASQVAGRGGGTSNQIDINVTSSFAGASADEASIAITGFTNDDNANKSYYTRVRMFSSDTPNVSTNMVYEGVFAQSTSQTLTVNARVQERLDFCVGATDVNDGTTTPTPTNGDCTDIAGSTVDIGNVEAGFTNVSPVTTVNGGSNQNGIAMVRTNAINGVVVDYKSITNGTNGNKLKISGAACVDNIVTTDPCFNSAGTTAATLTAGQEKFGMVVAGVNCVSTAAYTCAFGSGTYNLVRDPEYDGAAAPNNTFVPETNQDTAGTIGEYAWDDSGAADRIASSAGSTVKVVDDEALILKFAATAGVTTPTGAYTVQADFIATTTF